MTLNAIKFDISSYLLLGMNHRDVFQALTQKIEEKVEELVKANPSFPWEDHICYILIRDDPRYRSKVWEIIITKQVIGPTDDLFRHLNISRVPDSMWLGLLLKINRYHFEPDIMDTP